jgi:hypothetical protein
MLNRQKNERLNMARDLYGRDGRATHYVDDNDTLYTWGGRPIGFVNGEEIYTSAGRHVGRLSGGWVRDKSGNAVAFTSGASGGPIPPIPAIPPIKAIPAIPPIRSIPQIPPIPSIPTLGWSRYSLGDLFQ